MTTEERLIKLREMADEYMRKIEEGMGTPISVHEYGVITIELVMMQEGKNFWEGKIFPSALVVGTFGGIMTHSYHGDSLDELLTKMETSYGKELENIRRELVNTVK